jgi:hypothetical protein
MPPHHLRDILRSHIPFRGIGLPDRQRLLPWVRLSRKRSPDLFVRKGAGT